MRTKKKESTNYKSGTAKINKIKTLPKDKG
jgi:hypothetical protein